MLLGSVNGWICWLANIAVSLTSDVSSTCQSKTGALEGPEVDGFVKDMMELVKVSAYFFLFINTLYVQEESPYSDKDM